MLSFAHLLDADACPTCPTYENEVGQPVSPGMAGVSPTCPTCPTKKQALHKSQDAGAETPLSFEPLPGRYWLDPVDNGFLPDYKTMLDRKECRGCPQACQRCRALMADLETCMLEPEGGDA